MHGGRRGKVLRADLFRPVAEGRYPVILSCGPYAKGLAFQDAYKSAWMRLAKAFPEVLQGSSNKYQNWELVDPEKWVPDGWLRASQRKVDAARSLPYRPFHSHDEEWPLNPGEPIELDVEIWPTCIVVPAGYRLGLTVRGRDYEVTRRALRWRTPR